MKFKMDTGLVAQKWFKTHNSKAHFLKMPFFVAQTMAKICFYVTLSQTLNFEPTVEISPIKPKSVQESLTLLSKSVQERLTLLAKSVQEENNPINLVSP